MSKLAYKMNLRGSNLFLILQSSGFPTALHGTKTKRL